MADHLVGEKDKRGLMKWIWGVIAFFLLLGAILILASCLLGPEVAAVSWAGESHLSSQSSTPSSQAFIDVAKRAKASVVNVSSTRKLHSMRKVGEAQRVYNGNLNRRFRQPKKLRRDGTGSGVIVSTDGYIVTNHHIVENADELEVLLSDKRTFKAKMIGTDPNTDVAVIKIDATDLPILSWMDSAQLEVGELVLAVGSPFGLTQTVTMGIISAVGRANMGIVDYEDFIQTDTAINLGNSGGALVNLHGELVGINSAIFSRTRGSMELGFAIPGNMVKSVLDSVIKYGKVVRGWLGVSIQAVTPDLAKEFGVSETIGALVADVMEDSPASKAGLERGDIITEFDRKPVEDPTQLRLLVAESAPGTTMTITVLRNKQPRSLEVTVGEQPNDWSARREFRDEQGTHVLEGVQIGSLSQDKLRKLGITGGVVVLSTDHASPAARASLRKGDVIREINRHAVSSVEEFERHVSKLNAKEGVLLLITRGRATTYVTIGLD